MADRTTPIHSGYSIINASFSGTATAKLGCWMEYKVVSQSVENNTSTIRFYIFIANVAAQGGYLALRAGGIRSLMPSVLWTKQTA